MMANWPPDGYGEPQEWQKSEAVVSLIAAIVGLPLIALTWTEFHVFSDVLERTGQQFGSVLGVSESFIGMPLIIGIILIGLIAGLAITFFKLIIPFHEWIHFKIDRLLGLNPKYTREEFLFMKNPAVIPVSTRITLTENTLSALGPLVVIGVVAGAIILLADGILSGFAAFLLVTNSASSAGDLYNVLRFSRMPNGTLFANFEKGENEYRTEYVFPK